MTAAPQFPRKITRVAEARALATAFIPSAKHLIELNKASTGGQQKYPFVYAEHFLKDTLGQIIEWIMNKDTRIYKGPRRHFSALIADRMVASMRDLAYDYQYELNREDRLAFWEIQSERQRGPWSSGDGDGI